LMSIAVNFTGYRFSPYIATVAPYHGDGLQVEARVTYSVGSAVNPAYCKEWADWNKRSFMFGLLVDAGQEVDVSYKSLSLKYFALHKENTTGGTYGIVDQLNTDPGSAAGKRWVGFAQPTTDPWLLDDSLLSAGIIQFDVLVGIYPTVGPEFIPFVGRHLR